MDRTENQESPASPVRVGAAADRMHVSTQSIVKCAPRGSELRRAPPFPPMRVLKV
jgi:hypothetical protein